MGRTFSVQEPSAVAVTRIASPTPNAAHGGLGQTLRTRAHPRMERQSKKAPDIGGLLAGNGLSRRWSARRLLRVSPSLTLGKHGRRSRSQIAFLSPSILAGCWSEPRAFLLTRLCSCRATLSTAAHTVAPTVPAHVQSNAAACIARRTGRLKTHAGDDHDYSLEHGNPPR